MKQYALLPYQARFLADRSEVRVIEKSRRIGISWALAAEAALTAALSSNAGGMNTIYVGYNKEMTLDFISDVAWWAKQFHTACSTTTETVFEGDADQQILAYTIRFASGFKVLALSSKPTSLRSKHRALIILDEFAFHPDPDGLLKAAFANLIWGGLLAIVSTHLGVDNPFAKLVEAIKAGKRKGSLHRVTFDDALSQGLYERICLIARRRVGDKAAWRNEIIEHYAEHADEELFCIPSRSGGIYLGRDLIERNMRDGAVIKLTLPSEFLGYGQADKNGRIDAWLHAEVEPLVATLPKDRMHFFGMDFGRSSDRSIIIPGYLTETMRRVFPFAIELLNVPHRQQQRIVDWLIPKLPRFFHGAIDSTGNGSAIGEGTATRWGLSIIDQVKISSSWYATELPKFKGALADGRIDLVRSDDHVLDLSQFVVVNGQPALPKARVKSTDRRAPPRHGDAGIAYVLGYAASCGAVGGYEYKGVKAGQQVQERGTRDMDRDEPGARWARW